MSGTATDVGVVVFRLRQERLVGRWWVAAEMVNAGHQAWTGPEVAALERGERPATTVAEFTSLMRILGGDLVAVVNELVGIDRDPAERVFAENVPYDKQPLDAPGALTTPQASG